MVSWIALPDGWPGRVLNAWAKYAKEMAMYKFLIFLSTGCLLASGEGFAQAGSEVKGTLEINGATVPIKYAYALQHNDEEGFLDGPELRILLSDREVDPGLLGDLVLSRLDTMAREKKIRGLLLKLDPKKEPREIHGTLLEAPASPQASLPFFTQSGDTTSIKKLDIKDGKVSGVLEEKLSEDSVFPDTPKYGYNITFTAPIQAAAPVTARPKGEEALKSPQAQAILVYEKALREGRIEDAAKLATPEKFGQLEQAIQQMGKPAFLEQVKQFIPEAAVREKQIAEVIVRGKNAVVVIVEEGGRIAAPVTDTGGVWKAN